MTSTVTTDAALGSYVADSWVIAGGDRTPVLDAVTGDLVEPASYRRLRLGYVGPTFGRGRSRRGALASSRRQAHHIVGRRRSARGLGRVAPGKWIKRRLLPPRPLPQNGTQAPDHEDREREKDDRGHVKRVLHGRTGL